MKKNTDLLQSRDEVVAANCKAFPPEVFDSLTDTVRRVLTTVTDNPAQFPEKSRSALLLATLTNYSALLPGVSIMYGPQRYSVNLSYVYVSPSASNKGVMVFANCILTKVDEFIQQQSRAHLLEWETSSLFWEKEKTAAVKEGRLIDQTRNPGPRPRIAMLLMPSSTSKSQLIECIKANEQYGLIMKSTEINSLADAMDKDYGNFADSLCKALVNERIDRYYKVDDEPIVVERPMLSIELSGTFDQFHRLIPNFEDGLASRLFIFVGESSEDWISQRPKGVQTDYTDLYDSIADDAFLMWQYFSSHRIEVRFTTGQWDHYDEVWQERRSRIIQESGLSLTSIANRHPMMAFRMAATLTAIRFWETIRDSYAEGTSFDYTSQPTVLTCTDTDFGVATRIATTLFEHAMMMTTTKVYESPRGTRPMVQWRWSDEALSQMPDTFIAADFIDMASHYDRGEQTAYYTLTRFLKQKRLSRDTTTKPYVYRKR